MPWSFAYEAPVKFALITYHMISRHCFVQLLSSNNRLKIATGTRPTTDSCVTTLSIFHYGSITIHYAVWCSKFWACELFPKISLWRKSQMQTTNSWHTKGTLFYRVYSDSLFLIIVKYILRNLIVGLDEQNRTITVLFAFLLKVLYKNNRSINHTAYRLWIDLLFEIRKFSGSLPIS